MIRRSITVLALLGSALAATSCDSSSGCIVGVSTACSCVDGRMGMRTCKADRTFEACVCGDGLPDFSMSLDASNVDAGADLVCVAEADPAFCTRLGKTCETVDAPDNCGTARSVGCGTCAGTTPACVSNVCAAPVCGADYSGTGTPVPSLATGAAAQQALLGISASGASVLYLQAPGGMCVSAVGTTLVLADAATIALPTLPTYTKLDLTANANLAAFAKTEQTMTLSGNGLTVIGVATGGKSFLSSTRSALGASDFSVAAAGAYAAINAALPAAGSVSYPVQSADGLAFYYTVNGATNSAMNGIYEALRAQTTASFGAGQKMPAAVQAFGAVTGISSDRMTLFVSASFATSMLTRTSLLSPFATTTALPPGSAFRVAPVSSCGTLFGTCEPGGCTGESICVWNKK